eukprot:CAMPEP_0119499064 /NCGR_PEP_ID=MMETSP1344-20130328/21645_1 /TAXON_ID=236787 /ORGANISM="Florenciella parvula, Strain CCMP2471" /LENGTH=41 /DNA_ID= /DNA_START= /DNA_END= /DNA_ORIENTATION=
MMIRGPVIAMSLNSSSLEVGTERHGNSGPTPLWSASKASML